MKVLVYSNRVSGMHTPKATFVAAVALSSLLAAGPLSGEPLEVRGNSVVEGARHATAHDLLTLRDIDTFSVSPDGRFIAYQLRWADTERNEYRLEWFVAPSRPGPDPWSIGRAGEVHLDGAGGGFPGGTIRAISPALWSPDGRSIAYLKKKDSEVQVWQSDLEGKSQEQLTKSEADVRRFVWDKSGEKIYFEADAESRSELIELRTAESRTGYLLDERFFPGGRSYPAVRKSMQTVLMVYDLEERLERRATSGESAVFHSLTAPQDVPGRKQARSVRRFTDGGKIAWTEPANEADAGIRPLQTIYVSNSADSEEATRCEQPFCTGYIKGIWWSTDGQEIYYQLWEGVNRGDFAIYAWNIANQKVRKVFRGKDSWLRECIERQSILICAHETPVTPKRIVALNMADGSLTAIVDPNPRFQEIGLTEVERIEWTNDWDGWGRAAFGHLVKPIHYEPGKKYPLVVVQYRSRGFLRGGVGDEYPIHVLASNGFAVLSVDRPVPWELYASATNNTELVRRMFGDEHNDWNVVLQSLENGLDAVESKGFVDTERVGISGLSDGAVTVLNSLVNSDRFAAAAASSSVWDPILYYISGDSWRDQIKAIGFGYPEGSAIEFWRRISPALNAKNISTPLLLQLPDYEFVPSMQLITSMKEHEKVLEAYIFPNEYHIKWQPAHRLAIYKRNVDWFNFWLQGVEDPDPTKAQQYERWRKLRKQHEVSQQPDETARGAKGPLPS